jgi:hypothetical protein
MGFTDLCTGVPQNSVWVAKCPGFFQVIKIRTFLTVHTNISDSAYGHFDFPMVGILPDLAAGNTGFKAHAQ